jgi:hypothetical protein
MEEQSKQALLSSFRARSHGVADSWGSTALHPRLLILLRLRRSRCPNTTFFFALLKRRGVNLILTLRWQAN